MVMLSCEAGKEKTDRATDDAGSADAFCSLASTSFLHPQAAPKLTTFLLVYRMKHTRRCDGSAPMKKCSFEVKLRPCCCVHTKALFLPF